MAVGQQNGSDFQGLRVLAVDDENSLLNLVQKLLTRLGARVHVAEDLDRAREVLAHEPIDVLFCDHHLGKADTTEWVQNCRERFPAMKILVTSGQSMRNGSDLAFLPKPYSLASLQDAFRRLLQGG